MEKIIYIFLSSLFLSIFLVFILKKIFYHFKILDNPIKYKKNREAIPYSIWIIFFISFFIMSFLFLEHNYKIYLIWFFWFLITLVSFFDDLYNISPKIRLFLQIIIWFIIWLTTIKIWYLTSLFWWIDLQNYSISLFSYEIYIVSSLFTMIWYVFIFNALNWSDWIEWNRAFLSSIIFLIVSILGYILYLDWDKNAINITYIWIILFAIVLPFIFFEYKNHILMWDSWTMFLWFMVATLWIVFWWKIATIVIVFWIYFVDAIYVIFNRLKNHKNPLIWDNTHFHHRLMSIWMSKIQIIFFVWFFSFLFWFFSLFLDKIWKIFLFVFIVFFVIFTPKIIIKFIKNEKK